MTPPNERKWIAISGGLAALLCLIGSQIDFPSTHQASLACTVITPDGEPIASNNEIASTEKRAKSMPRGTILTGECTASENKSPQP